MKIRLRIMFFSFLGGICCLTLAHAAVPYGEWMRDWQLCGPFPLAAAPADDGGQDHLPGFDADFLKGCGGEKNPQPACRKGGLSWQPYSAPDSVVDLDRALSPQERAAAYAYREVVADGEKLVFLSLGSNDGCRVWLNGEQVWDYSAGRGLKPDQDLIPVMLKKGKNRLLLKIEERGNSWQFCVRLQPFSFGTLADQGRLFQIRQRSNGVAVLQFKQTALILKKMMRRLHCQVITEEAGSPPLWQAQWAGETEIPLGAPATHFDRYRLRLEAEAEDRTVWQTEMSFYAGRRTTHTVFADGRSEYVIVLGADASESEKWAAAELQHWLQECGGPKLEIRTDQAPLHHHEIILGCNRHRRMLLGDSLKRPHEADESFRYLNIGPHLLIYGGRLRGTMYGVFSLLERELGCRWYTPQVSAAPQKDRWSFDRLRHAEKPGIRVRNDFYYEAFDPIWAARNRVNGGMNYRDQPGGVEAYWSVHTFYRFMPPDEFYAVHPEYYSLIDGKRVYDHAQLCLTNPDVLAIITERMRRTMIENPQYLIYCLSQNDWHNPCQCEKCQALAKQEGSEAGPMVWFVNQVAEKLQNEFPSKFVGTLAYQYTRKPPRTVKPRENVVIRLCSIECCFAHDFHSCPENRSFVQDLEAWAAIAPHLYIWDYVVNFSHYIMPYPNFRVLQANIQTFRDNNAIGIMEQAAYQSRGGEFAELRAYVISRLLWDPECDVEEVIDDFMFGYYGRSGQYVRAYFDLLHGRVTPFTHIHLGLKPDDILFSDEWVEEADAVLNRAETVAENEVYRRRVEMARLRVWYLKCMRDPVAAREDGSYRRFQRVVERENITHYAESGAPHRHAFHQFVERAR